ncbi:hypothetical protein HU200_035791 [Digitaria exilis]|uniref:EF-hand domain-containing protein n=1 Tax=Digitaria exilis TaxID=1010633 RepID=A0A835BHW6_9POAL|nr:hypothetical protein HU200_035791 [Digitaria exilis]
MAMMCQQSYGFLPCTTTVLGNLFLIPTYGFLMYKGATYLSHGSELLLEIMGPGLVAGLLVPILGVIPEALTVLVSGLSGSRDTAQSQVLTGMGLLAGSTVFLLTLLWGTCVVVGKCDLGPNHDAVDLTNTKGFSLTGTGVSTDPRTTNLARIMAISVIPFIIVGLPNMMKMTHHGQRLAVLMALIVSFLLALFYCLYQVAHPWVQERRLAYVKHKLVIAAILRHAQMHALGQLISDDGTPNEDGIRKLFCIIDMDESRTLSRAELHAFIVGINFEDIKSDRMDAVDSFMAEFDESRNDTVEEGEFVCGMKRCIHKAKSSSMKKKSSLKGSGNFLIDFIHDYHEEHDELLDKPDEEERRMENPDGWFIAKAVGLLLLGTAMAALFADPLVDAVQNISNATRVPPFFISFVILPLVTNSIGEPVFSVMCVSNKRQRTASLTFSELYSGVAMKNTLCLGVFLALIYVRNLRWEFSSEMLMVVLVCVVVGLLASFRTTFPLWTCLVAYTMYPLSLVVVYVLDHVFHWS